jgi:hypothetical protein
MLGVFAGSALHCPVTCSTSGAITIRARRCYSSEVQVPSLHPHVILCMASHLQELFQALTANIKRVADDLSNAQGEVQHVMDVQAAEAGGSSHESACSL